MSIKIIIIIITSFATLVSELYRTMSCVGFVFIIIIIIIIIIIFSLLKSYFSSIRDLRTIIIIIMMVYNPFCLFAQPLVSRVMGYILPASVCFLPIQTLRMTP